ncbi:MAG: IS5 family transposase, partial [Verrucomicrobiales bacterium]
MRTFSATPTVMIARVVALPFDPVFMFKVLVLQKFHGLSDVSVEEQIADRFSFMGFLGLR